MHKAELIELSRDVDASIVPSGDRVILKQGEKAQITQTTSRLSVFVSC